MDPQGDVAAIWVALFDDLHGQILHDSSLSNEGVDLTGLEFSALPSGLHLVEEDVFFFDHNGLMGQCIFINEKSDASQEGGRGRRMWTVGVLVHPQPHQPLPSFHHLPFVRQAATSLSSFSEDFTLLNDYFQKHRRSTTTVPPPNSQQPKSQRLLGSSPLLPVPATLLSTHHPLTTLPLLIATFGPSVTTLYKFSLAGARILFYTRPPLKTSAEFAWCVWALGQREERSGKQGEGKEGEGEEKGSRFLGSVGLMDLGRLGEFGKEGRGWVGCTTDAILKERPHLYDLLIDLSSPLPYPPIFLSPPSPVSSSSKPTPPPRQITYSSSSLPLYNECLAILDPSSSSSSSSSLHPTHSHDCSSSHHSHDPQSSVPGWRGVVDVCLGACEWCLGMVLGRVVGAVTGGSGEGRVRLPSTEVEEDGDETTRPQPYEEESASSIGGDEEESSLEGDDDESVKRVPSTSTTPNPTTTQPQNDGPNDFNTPLSLLHLFTHSTTTLSRSIDHLVHKRTRQQLKQLKTSSPPSSNASIEIVLGARDLLKLGLGVGSDGGDARLLEKLANHPLGVVTEGGSKKGKKKGGKKGRSSAAAVGGEGGRKVRVRVEVGRWWSWVPGLA